jgi:hypothetical protein
MKTVERLEAAVSEAEKRGWIVRFEPLHGTAGGCCEMGRKRYIFIDLTATIADQLEQVLTALRTTLASPHGYSVLQKG